MPHKRTDLQKNQLCKSLYKVPYLHEGEVVSLTNAMHFLTLNKQDSNMYLLVLECSYRIQNLF